MVATVCVPALTGCVLAFHAQAESYPAAVLMATHDLTIANSLPTNNIGGFSWNWLNSARRVGPRP